MSTETITPSHEHSMQAAVPEEAAVSATNVEVQEMLVGNTAAPDNTDNGQALLVATIANVIENYQPENTTELEIHYWRETVRTPYWLSLTDLVLRIYRDMKVRAKAGIKVYGKFDNIKSETEQDCCNDAPAAHDNKAAPPLQPHPDCELDAQPRLFAHVVVPAPANRSTEGSPVPFAASAPFIGPQQAITSKKRQPCPETQDVKDPSINAVFLLREIEESRKLSKVYYLTSFNVLHAHLEVQFFCWSYRFDYIVKCSRHSMHRSTEYETITFLHNGRQAAAYCGKELAKRNFQEVSLLNLSLEGVPAVAKDCISLVGRHAILRFLVNYLFARM